MVTLGLSILAIAWALMMITPSGELAYAYVFFFLEYYAGVFSLVLLTMTVMGGLLSTDRILMGIKHRVLLQSAHRIGGIGAVGFLALHVATKASMGKASVMDAFVPFMSPFNALYIGLGAIASYLMVAVFLSGILRFRFLGSAKPWVWRGVHALSYVSWPIAIMHGLTAGRAAATWVTASYVVCLLLVTGALFLRLTAGSPRAKAGGGTSAGTGTGSLQPIRMPVASQREPLNGPSAWSTEPPPRPGPVDVLESGRPRNGRPRDDYESQYQRQYADYDAPSDHGYIDRSDSSARSPEQAYVTELIPVQRERERRRLEQQANLYGRPKAEDYGRRPRLERYEEEEEGGYVPRRSAQQPPPSRPTGEQQPISGPPRHRLVEENSDSYVPTDARIPTPRYVGTARPRRAIEARRPADEDDHRSAPDYIPFEELEPDDTPTLIDMATRRAARDSGERFHESDNRFSEPRAAAPSRRGRRRRSADEGIDERHWVS